MKEAQRLVANIMRDETSHFNTFDGNVVVDWLESNESRYVAFYFTRLTSPLIVLRDFPDNHYNADTLFISTKNRPDAEYICEVAKKEWHAQEADVLDSTYCHELRWYEHLYLVKVWWD